MNDFLTLQILSPERKLVSGVKVKTLTLPTSEGQIQILPGHAPIMGTVITGVMSYSGAELGTVSGTAAVSTGFFKVVNDAVTVLAETVELSNEIDLGRAKIAAQKAAQTLAEAELDDHKFRKYELKLQRALVRQQLGSGSQH